MALTKRNVCNPACPDYVMLHSKEEEGRDAAAPTAAIEGGDKTNYSNESKRQEAAV